jgi:uncharacterized integral membrane protein
VRLRRGPISQENLAEVQDRWQPLLYARLLALLVLVGYVIAAVVENNKQVHVHFVFTTARVSLIWVILLSLALGLLGGILLAQLERRRRRRGRPD